MAAARWQVLPGLPSFLLREFGTEAGRRVLQNARSYAEELVAGSELAAVEVVDQALNPELSRKLKV